MQEQGFMIDKAALVSFGESLTGTIAQLESAIYEHAGCEFNINSPKQLGEVLFDSSCSRPAKNENRLEHKCRRS